MTQKEFRQAVIDQCKKDYPKETTEYWPKEFEEAIKYWDERNAFHWPRESNGATIESQISAAAYGLMMCI